VRQLRSHFQYHEHPAKSQVMAVYRQRNQIANLQTLILGFKLTVSRRGTTARALWVVRI
jgi:hypothetical protein